MNIHVFRMKQNLSGSDYVTFSRQYRWHLRSPSALTSSRGLEVVVTAVLPGFSTLAVLVTFGFVVVLICLVDHGVQICCMIIWGQGYDGGERGSDMTMIVVMMMSIITCERFAQSARLFIDIR